jgi:hypothetical protein
LTRFIEIAELLDGAFTGPAPSPDYLAHKCEMAEQALFGLVARAASTNDARLAKLFALTLAKNVENRGCGLQPPLD